ncbi:glycosyltransferase family 4 protein [Carboxydochorda subterranea]|uniref:Glycosyltransferase family 4 protein n=1 Tax=Carboxydichorda subterranea TaxID=3109565 RepID=A0ABZ1BUC4_9FIRM|nr:glycosyltransferase family 4 protein [Limnochorda sp. L945t]WRP16389.1 glycosyltransferase family 4 protein [Limnochorda sp. L945t]
MGVEALRAPDRHTLSPETAVFTLLSFEGPDLYSRAGGLGVRVTQLASALARAGYHTHLVFVGDPAAPGMEVQEEGRLHLHRWCQWISRYYPQGVYEGEDAKRYDFDETVPDFVTGQIARRAVEQGKVLVVLAEEWHTAHTVCELSDRLWGAGLRHHALLAWNANNTMGFDRINWGRLGYVTTVTTVSRYMKHVMWGRGINPVVIPNGIADEALRPVPPRSVGVLRKGLEGAGGRVLLVKVGRFDPDKRWLMAVEAVALLKGQGMAPKMVIRGGIEPHEREVLERASGLGLRTMPVHLESHATPSELAQVISAHPEVDVFQLKFFVSDNLLRTLYQAADAVLANSGIEPFGLVGLEVMGAGGLPITGATGEDYAIAYHNAIVLETDDPREIAYHVRRVVDDPALSQQLRENGRATAARYTWSRVLPILVDRLQFAAEQQRLVWPRLRSTREDGGGGRSRPEGAGEVKEAAAALEEVR